MYNPLQFFQPTNARFDLAGQTAGQIAESNRLRDARESQLQGFQGLQDLATLRANNIPLNEQQQVDESQYQMEALGSPEKFMNYQLMQERAKNVGRRGVTGNAESIQTAIKNQAPYEAKLNILENELNNMNPTDDGYQEKFSQFQTLMGEHDKLAFNEGQKWLKKQSTRTLQEDFQDDKRKQAEEKRKQGTYANMNFKGFRDNFQKQNKKLVDSADVAKGITPLTESASKGNTQSVASIVKRIARMASNEAIVMPELLLGFSGSVEDRADAWLEQFVGSGNRIPESELKRVKESYNATVQMYNDVLGDAVIDGISDWKKYSSKAKGMSNSALQRQMFGKDYKSIPLWTDIVDYESSSDPKIIPKTDPNAKSDRDKGDLPPPNNTNSADGIELDVVNEDLKRWMNTK